MSPLRAFHGDPAIKEKYLARVKAHQLADEIIKGTYWQNGKGCAVGCTLHSAGHSEYESELGIPKSLGWLQDKLFESLPDGDYQTFPFGFLEAIPVGADLSLVKNHFLHWLLVDPVDGVLRFADEQGKSAIQQVAALHFGVITGAPVSDAAWDAAGDAARDAAGDAVRDAVTKKQAEKLLELLASAPVVALDGFGGVALCPSA